MRARGFADLAPRHKRRRRWGGGPARDQSRTQGVSENWSNVGKIPQIRSSAISALGRLNAESKALQRGGAETAGRSDVPERAMDLIHEILMLANATNMV